MGKLTKAGFNFLFCRDVFFSLFSAREYFTTIVSLHGFHFDVTVEIGLVVWFTLLILFYEPSVPTLFFIVCTYTGFIGTFFIKLEPPRCKTNSNVQTSFLTGRLTLCFFAFQRGNVVALNFVSRPVFGFCG